MSAEDVPQPLVSSDTQQNPHPFSPIIESTVPAASGEREGNPFAALQEQIGVSGGEQLNLPDVNKYYDMLVTLGSELSVIAPEDVRCFCS